MVTLLERKIRWFFENCSNKLTAMDFELVLVAKFDANNKLTFQNQEEVKKARMKFWKGVIENISSGKNGLSE